MTDSEKAIGMHPDPGGEPGPLPGRKMPMDEEQICIDYRTAAKPSAQIKILAELNDTTPERIVEILESHGCKVDRRGLRLKKPLRDPAEWPGATPQPAKPAAPLAQGSQEPAAAPQDDKGRKGGALHPDIYAAALATIKVLEEDEDPDEAGDHSFRQQVRGILALINALEVCG